MSLNIKTSTGRQVLASNGDVLVAGRDLNVYSNNETVIGYWTDGKPLYRKVFYYEQPGIVANNTWYHLSDISDLNIDFDNPVLVNSYVNDSGISWSNTCDYRATDATGLNIMVGKPTHDVAEFRKKINVISYNAGAGRYNHDLYIILEYTKTTDQPVTDTNSYSTEEKLTGETWIDGKPIWRKVIQSTTPSTSGVNTNIVLVDSNLDNVIKLDYYFKADNYIYTSAANGTPGGYFLASFWINPDNQIRGGVGNNDYTNKDIWFIVEYTKTT